MKMTQASLQDFFAAIDDPRVDRTKKHSLHDILMLTLIATLCGADNWILVEEFGKARISWLKTYLSLPNGIPSHDTLSRVFSLLNPEQFEQFFIHWATQVSELTEGELICIDGKTLRGSHDKYYGKEAIHLVNAWAENNEMVIGQLRSEGKSNEINTIPELLDLLAIKGCVISIDAMGCQKDIAENIIEHEADYLLALKNNQPTLNEEVRSTFAVAKPHSTDEQILKDHGRIETRKCTVIDNIKWVDEAKNWKGIKSVIKIESKREVISSKKQTEQTRYYISSLLKPAEYFNKLIKSHWAIENKLHYVLDVAFAEDACRVRQGFADQNLAIMRKITLNLLKADTSAKMGIKNKRFKAGWDNDYLRKVLKI